MQGVSATSGCGWRGVCSACFSSAARSTIELLVDQLHMYGTNPKSMQRQAPVASRVQTRSSASLIDSTVVSSEDDTSMASSTPFFSSLSSSSSWSASALSVSLSLLLSLTCVSLLMSSSMVRSLRDRGRQGTAQCRLRLSCSTVAVREPGSSAPCEATECPLLSLLSLWSQPW